MKDPWAELRKFTQARIGIGRAGHAVTTSALLEFQYAHALARDAIHLPWDLDSFRKGLGEIETLEVQSRVRDRWEYLRRPDFGRSLADDAPLQKLRGSCEIVLIVSNGLSSSSTEHHGAPFVRELVESLRRESVGRMASVILVPNGRVAISDSIGEALGATLALMVVGERPGLSAPDSLALYLTYHPRIGNNDAGRNCISNIRPPQGLSYGEAVFKTMYLVKESLRRKLSGVALKDEAPRYLPILVGRP